MLPGRALLRRTTSADSHALMLASRRTQSGRRRSLPTPQPYKMYKPDGLLTPQSLKHLEFEDPATLPWPSRNVPPPTTYAEVTERTEDTPTYEMKEEGPLSWPCYIALLSLFYLVVILMIAVPLLFMVFCLRWFL